MPRGKWFCCTECNRIHSTLQKLLITGAEKLPDAQLDIIKKKHEEKSLDTTIGFDVRWRLISGKIASPESRVLLSKAVSIFHVSLLPFASLVCSLLQAFNDLWSCHWYFLPFYVSGML